MISPVFDMEPTKVNIPTAIKGNRNVNFTNDQKIAVNDLTNFINSDFNESKFIYGLVGPGGVGKTFVIKYIVRNCKYATSVIRFTAPTHKACRVFSQALDGIETYTIQSTFGFRINMNLADFDYKNPQFDPMASPKLDNIELLIIDESSKEFFVFFDSKVHRIKSYISFFFRREGPRMFPMNNCLL